MMKTKRAILQAATAACIALAASGCVGTGIRHVSAREFLVHAESMEHLNSASSVVYVGTTHKRAYLQHWGWYPSWHIFDRPTMVYWTELDALPTKIANQLRTGRLPWTPWEEHTEEEKWRQQQPERD